MSFWAPSERLLVLSSATQRDRQLLTPGDLNDPSRDNLRSYPRSLHPNESVPHKYIPPPTPIEVHPFRRHPSDLVCLPTVPKCPSTDSRCNGQLPLASIIGDGKSLYSTSSRFIGAVFRKPCGGAGAGQDTLRISV